MCENESINQVRECIIIEDPVSDNINDTFKTCNATQKLLAEITFKKEVVKFGCWCLPRISSSIDTAHICTSLLHQVIGCTYKIKMVINLMSQKCEDHEQDRLIPVTVNSYRLLQ